MKTNKFFQKWIILSSIVFTFGCDGGGGGSSSGGGKNGSNQLVPTSNQFADDDLDGVINNKDCAPLDPTKSLVKYKDNDGDDYGSLENSICSSVSILIWATSTII